MTEVGSAHDLISIHSHHVVHSLAICPYLLATKLSSYRYDDNMNL